VKKRFYEKPPPRVNIKIKFFSRVRGHPAAAARAVLAEGVCPRCFLGFQGNPVYEKSRRGVNMKNLSFFALRRASSDQRSLTFYRLFSR
jgi:hypothetical protein